MNEHKELKETIPGAASTEPQDIPDRLESLEQTVKGLSDQINGLNRRLELIPQQVRQLGIKVDDITESIAHPRTRDMLNRLVQLYDLVNQMAQEKMKTGNPGNLQVLEDQIMQILEVNGIYPIDIGERFDPNLHKAVEIVECQTPEEAGEISRLYRMGFRTDRAILRYAEVLVKKYNKQEEIKKDSPKEDREE
jgi:molecular chaperone GrpE